MKNVKCIRVAKVMATDKNGLNHAIFQANEVARSFVGTMTNATVKTQKRKTNIPYYDIYIELKANQ